MGPRFVPEDAHAHSHANAHAPARAHAVLSWQDSSVPNRTISLHSLLKIHAVFVHNLLLLNSLKNVPL